MAKEMSNISHVCAENKVELKQFVSSFENLPFEDSELRRILDFYVFHAPILKDSKEEGNGFGLRYLGEYGWKTSAELSNLERELLKKAGITRFVMIKADSIKGILDDMNLDGNICIIHPRAVFMQQHRLSIDEYGVIKNDSSEKRMVCLFRHMRNSLAHNRVYSFSNNMILLEDLADDAKTISARILINASTMLEWIYVVDKNKNFYDSLKSSEEK